MRKIFALLFVLSFQTVLISVFAQTEVQHEYVDLGLSVKWATCNVGADKPEDSGDFFAWGETSPYYSSLNPTVWKPGKEGGYIWSSYFDVKAYSTGDPRYHQSNFGMTFKKYDISTGNTVLEAVDDAAHVNWGGNWRIPTDKEIKELIENCTWTWTTLNGVQGYKIVSRSNGNSIFLSAAKFLADYDSDHVPVYYTATYWSASLSSSYSYCAGSLFFNMNNHVLLQDTDRNNALPIRPVCP